jgi:hypothetical protein
MQVTQRGQNADNRNNDHQFDQGKTLLDLFHVIYSFFELSMRFPAPQLENRHKVDCYMQ